ncbi:ATP-binding cassette domain-containing protein [Microbacterium oleivorans]|uniref:ATP-binding cassette domain-containing protein n=1 Tax=Microbacterium oleivorans TaxID=273677 RepID=A0A7D5IVH1_9MICO|nr:ATP-binding cassette domain-containing protein [Microbacterium oleivorans]QLD11222.1 ATP-binding cassette domain-containing protein [Microbacterium oleivorans]
MIEIFDAHKRYGSSVALAAVDLSAEPGQVTAVIGPNGAGKSTLFRAVLGLEILDAGTALVDGRPYERARAPLRTLGAAIDPSAFHPGRRVVDEVRIATVSQGLSSRRVDAVLDETGLGLVRRRRIRALSLGMRQRLNLAVALIGRPRNLILDEPLNGLDVDGIHWMRGLLREAADGGCAVLISSHILSELERVADRIHVLASGRMISSADIASAGEPSRHVVVVSDDPEALRALLISHATDVAREGRALLVRGMTVRAVADVVFRNRFFVESLAESRDSLESDYLRLLAEAAPFDPVLRESPRPERPS